MSESDPSPEITGLRLRYSFPLEGRGRVIAWSPDGERLAIPGKGIGRMPILGLREGESAFLELAEVAAVAVWSPDGKRLAVGGSNQFIHVYDALTGARVCEMQEASGWVISLAWSPNDEVIASGSWNGTIQLRNAISGEVTKWFPAHSAGVNTLAWSPDGTLLASGSSDCTTRIFDREGNVVAIFGGHHSACHAIAWSPDGSMLASGSKGGTVRIWNVREKRETNLLQGHTGPITSVSFSGDGRLLATRSGDGTVRLWRTDRWDPVTIRPTHIRNQWRAGVAFNPKHSILATLDDEEKTVQILEVDTEHLLGIKADESISRYTNAKVVLVGDSGVGKSGLAMVLSGQSFHATPSTHGRKVVLFRREEIALAGSLTETRETLLWDLAGQPNYRLIHQLHLDEASVAVVVFDPRSETDPFAGVRHWHRALLQAEQVSGRNKLVKLLVAARADRGGLSVSRSRIDAFVREFGFAGYFETSARENIGIVELADAIAASIDWNVLPRTTSPALFTSINQFLIAEKEQGRVLATGDELFRAFHHSSAAPDLPEEQLKPIVETCIRLLESRGMVMRLSFGEYRLLQPEIIDAYASALINAAKEEPDGIGAIREDDIHECRFRMSRDERLADPHSERLVLIAAIEGLLRHEIALREETGTGMQIVFPSQFMRERSDLPDPPGKEVVFLFEGPLTNIYATLAVRLSRSGTFERQEMWRNAATFKTKNGERCGLYLREIDEAKAELGLFFDPGLPASIKAEFERYIHVHLQRHALPQSISRRRLFACHSCQTPINDLAVTRRRERGFQTITCPVCEALVSLEEPAGTDDDQVTTASQLAAIDQSADQQRDRAAATAVLAGKQASGHVDVLCIHDDDGIMTEKIAGQLRQRGVLPRVIQYLPSPDGRYWEELANEIDRARVVALFIRSFEDFDIGHLRRNDQRFIVVLLEGVGETGWSSRFPSARVIDFASASHGLDQLISEITGKDWSVSAASKEDALSLAQSPEERLTQRLEQAERTQDYLTVHQALTDLTKMADDGGRADIAIAHAQKSCEIVDDPAKLRGVGFLEPLEVLTRLSPDWLQTWLPAARFRENAVGELRRLAASMDGAKSLLRSASIAPWEAWFSQSPPDVTRLQNIPRSGNGWPAARLLRLRLKNIKSFRELVLDFRESDGTARTCFALVGDNATGKTTILQAIAIASLGTAFASQLPGRMASRLLRNGEQSGSIEAEFELSVDAGATAAEKMIVAVGLEATRQEEDFRPLDDSRMTFGRLNRVEHWAAMRRQASLQWGLCCGYGPFRGMRERPDNSPSTTLGTKPEIDRVLSLFQPHSSLLDPALLDRLLQKGDISAFSVNPLAIPLGVRDRILAMFQEVVPGLEIRDQSGGSKQLTERHSGIAMLSALSDGCNCMVGLLGHLVRHALEVGGWSRNPAEAAGIVLIDELDLHLHPSWQRRALPQLQAAFPQLQFIITTHSPLILGGIPDGRVTILRRSEEGDVSADSDTPSVRGWRVDQLLTGLHFETFSYDVATEQLTERYAKLLNDPEASAEEVERALQKLDEIKGPAMASDSPDRQAVRLIDESTQKQVASMEPETRKRVLAELINSFPGGPE